VEPQGLNPGRGAPSPRQARLAQAGDKRAPEFGQHYRMTKEFNGADVWKFGSSSRTGPPQRDLIPEAAAARLAKRAMAMRCALPRRKPFVIGGLRGSLCGGREMKLR